MLVVDELKAFGSNRSGDYGQAVREGLQIFCVDAGAEADWRNQRQLASKCFGEVGNLSQCEDRIVTVRKISGAGVPCDV